MRARFFQQSCGLQRDAVGRLRRFAGKDVERCIGVCALSIARKRATVRVCALPNTQRSVPLCVLSSVRALHPDAHRARMKRRKKSRRVAVT